MSSPYATFFLSSPRSAVELDLLEISHPSFSKTYYIVRNAIGGITVTHEDATVRAYEYYPLSITRSGAIDDLDSSLSISLGDLGELVSSEIDLVRAAGTFLVKPTLKYRIYRSDDLTAPIYGPFLYQIPNVAITRDGSAISAVAQALNVTTTGEYYTTVRFPSLRGML